MHTDGLLTYRKSIYSQFGEEGIIEYLLEQLDLKFIECCEFGMSGTIFSNTLYFLENYDSYGVIIDKESKNLTELNLPNITKLVKEVSTSGENSLDNILLQTKLTSNFDILSIDVDNEDYLIWKSLKKYSPKIVLIEFNPFIHPSIEYVYNGTRFSSSFKSTVKLGIEKGYKLVSMPGNLIFVKVELLKNSSLEYLLDIRDTDLFLNDAVTDPKNPRSITFKRYLNSHLI